jgi:hypothetical protein
MPVDRGKIIDVLGLTTGGDFVIADLRLHEWGRAVQLTFEYTVIGPDDAPEPPTLFDLTFHDCREVRLKTYAHIALAEVGGIAGRASLAEIALGHGNHRRDANLLTSHFGLTVSYGHIALTHGDEIHTL